MCKLVRINHSRQSRYIKLLYNFDFKSLIIWIIIIGALYHCNFNEADVKGAACPYERHCCKTPPPGAGFSFGSSYYKSVKGKLTYVPVSCYYSSVWQIISRPGLPFLLNTYMGGCTSNYYLIEYSKLPKHKQGRKVCLDYPANGVIYLDFYWERYPARRTKDCLEAEDKLLLHMFSPCSFTNILVMLN